MEILQYADNKHYNIGDDIHKGDRIVISCGGRNIGKTFSAKCWFWNRVCETGKPFVTLVREVAEVNLVANDFFDNLQARGFLTNINFYSYDVGKNIGKKLCYQEDGKEICVSIILSLKKSDTIKRMSLENTCGMFFDELISENGVYLRNEPNRLLSIYNTCIRSRELDDFPVLLLGNICGYYCPYFGQWDIEPPPIGNTVYYKNGKLKFMNLPDGIYEKGSVAEFINDMSETYGDLVNNNTLYSLPLGVCKNGTHICKILVGNRCISYDYESGYMYFSLTEDRENAIVALDIYGNKPIDSIGFCTQIVRSIKRSMIAKRVLYENNKCYSVIMELCKLYN